MKHLTRLSLTALAVIALFAAPVSAQSRGGSSSRSGGSHTSGMSHSGGSRSGGYSGGSSRSYGGGSYSRSSGSSSRSYGGYSRSSGSSSRSYSTPQTRGGSSSSRSSGSVSRQTAPRSSGSVSRSNGSVSRSGSATAPRSNGNVSRSNGSAAPRSSAGTARTTAPSGSRTGSSASRANGTRPVGISAAAASRAAGSAVTRGEGTPRSIHMNNENPNVRHIAPRDRRPMPYDRPDRFWHGHHHCFGYRVDFLPHGYVMHHYWGRPYYYYDGFWYRHYHGCYYFCRPPFGYVYVPDVIDVAYAACRIAYYCAELNTYRTVNENAQTIADQNTIIAQNNATIAQQNAEIAMNADKAREAYETANGLGLVQAYADASTEYFYDDGVFFTKSADGKYTVIVPPAGALVTDLPDDYDIITLEGKEYYKVDDTIFELKVVDGTAYFQVLGQMTGELAEQYDLNNNAA